MRTLPITVVLLLLVACGGSQSPGTPTAIVEVSAEGTHLDPAVETSQIPEGSYYCDMGTSHYAQLKKGDGKCPRCGMDLVHKAPAPQAGGHGH